MAFHAPRLLVLPRVVRKGKKRKTTLSRGERKGLHILQWCSITVLADTEAKPSPTDTALRSREAFLELPAALLPATVPAARLSLRKGFLKRKRGGGANPLHHLGAFLAKNAPTLPSCIALG